MAPDNDHLPLALIVFGVVSGVGPLASAPLFVLPPHRYGLVLAVLEIATGAVLLSNWRRYRAGPEAGRPSRWRLAVLAAVFLAVVGGSVDASADTVIHAARPQVSDPGPHRSPCGPFGILGPWWNHRALARVRAAFPGRPVHLAEGCRSRDDAFAHEVRVRVGPFRAPGRATRLLVTEAVTDGGDLSPYPDAAAAIADLPRLDRLPRLAAALGQGPRLCDLEPGYGGFGPAWYLECSPETAGHPLTRPCTHGARCVAIDVAWPPRRVEEDPR